MVKKAVYKGLSFLIILVILISTLNSIFTIKTAHGIKLSQGLYQHTGNEYDVVMLGSSHMNGAINPNLLWSEYGITSFNYATAGQPIDVTYYLLKEVLKKHEKPIVVVDLYYLGLTYKFGVEGYIRYVLDNMKFSYNKIDAVINSTPKEQWASYILPLIKYHDRWKELKDQDFKPDTSMNYYAKGFSAGRNLYGKESLSDTSVSGTAELPPKTEEYLYKIIDLSKKEGFQLVFVNVPYDYTSTASKDNWHKEPAKMFNKVDEISQKNNIPFINYCNKFEEIGFDFKRDMFNIGHVNIWGAEKLTIHLGDFLQKNYTIMDKRNDEKYAQWNEDYKKYVKSLENVK